MAERAAEPAAAAHRLPIGYCARCRRLPRAEWFAQEVLGTFDPSGLAEAALKPGVGGGFVVRGDGEAVWDRCEQGFPEPAAVRRAARDRAGRGRTLGHGERQGAAAPCRHPSCPGCGADTKRTRNIFGHHLPVNRN
ncbi:SelT/SelW/SelH family protein [Streptomyces sp. I6]|nr:SelT/SelW/SelH family protein [Streptomyces sp. I6]